MSQAVRLVEELLDGWAPVLREVVVVPASGGRFEVTLDDALIYSKLETGRHARPGEIADLVRARIGDPIARS